MLQERAWSLFVQENRDKLNLAKKKHIFLQKLNFFDEKPCMFSDYPCFFHGGLSSN